MLFTFSGLIARIWCLGGYLHEHNSLSVIDLKWISQSVVMVMRQNNAMFPSNNMAPLFFNIQYINIIFNLFWGNCKALWNRQIKKYQTLTADFSSRPVVCKDAFLLINCTCPVWLVFWVSPESVTYFVFNLDRIALILFNIMDLITFLSMVLNKKTDN